MNKLIIAFFLISLPHSVNAEPNRYGEGYCVNFGDGRRLCISDVDPNSEDALNLKKLASESRGEKDFIERLKESTLEKQAIATQKYKKGVLSKNEYVEASMQIGAIAEYIKKNNKVSPEPEVLKPQIVTLTQKFEVGSPNIDNVSDENLKKLENKDIPLLRAQYKEFQETQKKHAVTQIDLKCGSVNDCAALAVGSKICGGPVNFLVISKLDPNFTSTSEKLDIIMKADQKFQRLVSGFASTCSYETPPRLDCRSNVCVAL